MTTLYLIRHGQTDTNIYGGFNGSSSDQELNETGREMAAALVDGFANIHFDAIYSSPLKRACQTAEGVRGHRDMEIVTDPDLSEIDFGEWEGMTYKQGLAHSPDAMWMWHHDIVHFRAPGACEDVHFVATRMFRALRRILCAHRGQTVAIVSHGFAIRVMFARLLRIGAGQCRRMPFFYNAAHGVLEIEDDGHFRIRNLNRRDYYKPEEIKPSRLKIVRRQTVQMQRRTYFHPGFKIK